MRGDDKGISLRHLVFSSTRGSQRSYLKITYSFSLWRLHSFTSLDDLVLRCCWNCSHQVDHEENSLALTFNKNWFYNPPEGWIYYKDASGRLSPTAARSHDSWWPPGGDTVSSIDGVLGARTGTCLLCEWLWEKAARALFHRKPHAAAACPVSVRPAAAQHESQRKDHLWAAGVTEQTVMSSHHQGQGSRVSRKWLLKDRNGLVR